MPTISERILRCSLQPLLATCANRWQRGQSFSVDVHTWSSWIVWPSLADTVPKGWLFILATFSIDRHGSHGGHAGLGYHAGTECLVVNRGKGRKRGYNCIIGQRHHHRHPPWLLWSAWSTSPTVSTVTTSHCFFLFISMISPYFPRSLEHFWSIKKGGGGISVISRF